VYVSIFYKGLYGYALLLLYHWSLICGVSFTALFWAFPFLFPFPPDEKIKSRRTHVTLRRYFSH
jgi:hypothetical protein